MQYLNYLKIHFTGLIKIAPHHEDYLVRVTDWNRYEGSGKLEFAYSSYINEDGHEIDTGQNTLELRSFIYLSKMEAIPKVYKRNISPWDPYGEEVDEDELNESFNGGEINTLHHGSFLINGEPTLRYKNSRKGNYFIDVPISRYSKPKVEVIKGDDPYDEEIWDDDIESPMVKHYSMNEYDNIVIIVSSDNTRMTENNKIKHLECIIGVKKEDTYGEVKIKNLNYIYQICYDLGFKP